MARTSRMENEADRKKVALMYAEGCKREDIATEFDVHPDTVTAWSRRPEVQALITKFTEERTNRILRRVDTALEGRLQHVDKLDTETLLKIRKEFVPATSETTIKIDQSGATEDLLEQLAADPELAQKILGEEHPEDVD